MSPTERKNEPLPPQTFLQREAGLFRKHRAAYFGLFLAKLAAFFVILRLHRASGLKGELIPALILSLVGIGMTILFQHKMNNSQGQSR